MLGPQAGTGWDGGILGSQASAGWGGGCYSPRLACWCGVLVGWAWGLINMLESQLCGAVRPQASTCVRGLSLGSGVGRQSSRSACLPARRPGWGTHALVGTGVVFWIGKGVWDLWEGRLLRSTL